MANLITLGARKDIAAGGRYFAFPAACRSGAVIVSGWADAAQHVDSGSSGKIAISRDYGATWSQPIPVTNAPNGRGAVWLSNLGERWAMLQMDHLPGQRYKGYITVSTDPLQWPLATEIDWHTTSFWGVFPCNLVWLDDGSDDGLMLATGYCEEGVLVAGSKDAGASWERWANPASKGNGNETTITPLPDGRLMMLTRVDPSSPAGPDSHNDIRYSSDWGRTWTPGRLAIPNTSALPTCGVMPDGTLVVTLRDNTLVNGSSRRTWALAVSQDLGETWTTQQINSELMMYGAVVPTVGNKAVLIGSSEFNPHDARIWVQQLTVAPAPGGALPSQSVSVAEATERWLIGDFRTGAVVADMPVTANSRWSCSLDQTTISAELDWSTAAARAILPQVYPWTAYLAVTCNDEILAAGPLLSDTWDADQQTLTLNAQGAEAYLARRTMMNPDAFNPRSRLVTLYDPDAKKVPAWAQLAGGGKFGQIIKAFVTAVLGITDLSGFPLKELGRPPVVCDWPPEYGGHQKIVVDSIDHMPISEWLDDIAEKSDGVEWHVRPRWKGGSPEGGVMEWNIDIGAPLIGGRFIALDATGIRGLRTTRDGSKIATGVHGVGGKQGNRTLTWSSFGAGSNFYLETVDTSHSQIDKQAELIKVTTQMIASLSGPTITATANAPIGSTPDWGVGDFLSLTGDQSVEDEWRSGVLPHLPANLRMRVLGRSGQAGTGVVDIDAVAVKGADADAFDTAAA